MNLVQRVQDILLKPKETWPQIAVEPGDATSLYKDYLIYLALVPAVAGFIGLTLFGVGGFGFSFRMPIGWGLANMVVSFVMSLVAVFLLSLIANALAPNFGGTKDAMMALKLVAYGSTAGFVGGVFSLVPQLAILGLLASLYSIYLIFTGVPVLMKCPEDKAMPYTAVLIVCSIVAMVILGALSAVFTGGATRGMMMGARSGAPDVSINTPGGSVSINTAKLEEMAKKMEDAGKRMESAQSSGDSAAAGKAAAEVMGAMMGGGGVPFASQDLKSWLPEKLGGLTREGFEVQSGAAMGIAGSTAHATYTAGDQQIRLTITDVGGLGGLMSIAAWANVTVDKESNGQVEKVYKQGQRTIREEYRKDGSQAEYTVVLGNGLIVELQADQSSIDKVKQAMAGVDLGKMESAQRPPKT
jgi:Yip1 domain